MNGSNGVNDYYESDNEMEDVEDVCEEQEEFEEASDSEGDPDELDYDVDIEGDESEYCDECPVNISHFDLIKKLGTGAYGTVFLVRKNCGCDIDSVYALKVITKAEVVKVPKTIVHMKAERKALEILRNCPYIQKLYYAFQTSEKLFLVTEYLPGGEMFQQVQKGELSEEYVRFYIAELVVALEHIHKQGIVYRDIKLENVLLDAQGHVKLVDFGLCKKLGARGRSKSFCGTEEYMAPEVIACTGHNTAADWWALGVLAIELLSSTTPFGITDGNDTIMNRVTNHPPTMPAGLSKEMHDFLTKMLNKNPCHRLGGSERLADEIKQHPLFDGIDWKKLERKLLPSPAPPPTITHPFDIQNFAAEFTQEEPSFAPSEEPPNSFLTFKGYSYIAPELTSTQTNHLTDDSIDENWNSLARHVFSNRDPDSEFHRKYRLASHQPLGTGKSSVCMKCFNIHDNNYYAVKIYKRTDLNANEIEILQRAEAVPGVVLLHEVLTDSKWVYLVMELIHGDNLLKSLSKWELNGKTINETLDELWKIVKRIHECKYTHGRICFKNIFYLRESTELRFIGFGNAKPITRKQDAQIDYWSMGVCIYTLLCGHSPFKLSTTEPTDQRQVADDKFDEDSKEWSALHKDIKKHIKQLLRNSTPKNTPQFKAALINMGKIAFPSVNCSKERLDENKIIVEMRACELTMPLADIKKEVNYERNGIDEVISESNGVDEVISESNGTETINGSESVDINDGVMDVDDDQLPIPPNNISAPSQHNGPHSPKRRISHKDEVKQPTKHPKTERELRKRIPNGEVHKPNRQPSESSTKPKAVSKILVIKNEPDTGLPPPNTKKPRGRPPKQNPTVAVPPARPTATIQTVTSDRPTIHMAQNRSTGEASADLISLGEQALSNWVYGWRPLKVRRNRYVFIRFDHEKRRNQLL